MTDDNANKHESNTGKFYIIGRLSNDPQGMRTSNAGKSYNTFLAAQEAAKHALMGTQNVELVEVHKVVASFTKRLTIDEDVDPKMAS